MKSAYVLFFQMFQLYWKFNVQDDFGKRVNATSER